MAPTSDLPTFDQLGAQIPDNLDAGSVAAEWFKSFSKHAAAGNGQEIAALFAADSYWRDLLALTWDFRTFHGPALRQFLSARLPTVKMSAFALSDEHLCLKRPFPDMAWVEAMFKFETDVGYASGIMRLIPQADGVWKAYCMFTNLEALKGFPEKIGPLRNPEPEHGKWEERRQQKTAFETTNPTVLVIGSGQSGLALAAHLQNLDVSVLVVEQNERIGDNWRNRYDALCLHDPVWYDHMPYLPFPPTWPVYTPARKMANWLESFFRSWKVTVRNRVGGERILDVQHLVFATGFGSYRGALPTYPGMDTFKGQLLHSSQHKRASDHKGKKVVVIGACTSAHDICADYYKHDIDVTMYQRSSTYIMSTKHGWPILMGDRYSEDGPPTEIADIQTASVPMQVVELMAPRRTLKIAEADKDLLEGLKKCGFRLNLGYKDCGFSLAVWEHAGGYYIDVGTSQLLIDGKIKLKNDSLIESFSASGLVFENGTRLEADVVVFATGVGNVRDNIRRVCGDIVADRCKPIWGLDAEGEVRGCWRDLGNLAYSRFYSKHLALQIKAIQEGLFKERYSLDR
ncbi:unnamed protein product [Mycena citricolor]|uniref:FAD/NAD(P)-binding domain-containing protein n=1 Tax=Mycena citricolor TaxID=2018698 RepID=A0AAD2HI67_9AGAR|nr:unnamed protein product [Mycena citricolor]